MQQLKTLLAAGLLIAVSFTTSAQSGPVGHFKKVIVSPYIQVTFVQGEKESVTINDMIVDSSKLHVEVQDGILRLYLDGAKDIPHNQHVYNSDGGKQSHPLYPNHAVIATVTYRALDALSLRGEETQLCKGLLSADEFTLRIYGESKVIFEEVHIGEMHTTMYGESSLNIEAGSVDEQYYTCYGEGKINTTAIAGRESKLTAFGEAEFKLNVSDRIKITALGRAKLRYMGNPDIVKGIHIGGLDLERIN